MDEFNSIEEMELELNRLEKIIDPISYISGKKKALKASLELVKKLTMPDVVGQSEQLKAFREWTRENLDEKDIVTQQAVDRYLESL